MAKSYQAGVSTLGIVLCYAPETTAGVKPTTGWTTLHRINEIGDISLSSETIDASALEDYVERTVAVFFNSSPFPIFSVSVFIVS